MLLAIEPLAIPDIKLVTPRKFGDARGFFSESFNQKTWAEAGMPLVFVQDNHSFSAPAGTLRGLHAQSVPAAQTKLVRVTRGAILDVAVDIRHGSPTYGQHVSAVLSAENWKQILVPEGFLHGFVTLEPDTEVLYKVTSPYTPENEFGVRWDDPALGIDWRLNGAAPLLSDRDTRQPAFADLPVHFRYASEVAS